MIEGIQLTIARNRTASESAFQAVGIVRSEIGNSGRVKEWFVCVCVCVANCEAWWCW